jgi:hypothetical protein
MSSTIATAPQAPAAENVPPQDPASPEDEDPDSPTWGNGHGIKTYAELALPVQERRYPKRDESLSRLGRATGIDPSTLIKWMRYESSKGQPKLLITPEKIREVLASDGTTTLEALYPDAEVVHLTSSQTPRLARAA